MSDYLAYNTCSLLIGALLFLMVFYLIIYVKNRKRNDHHSSSYTQCTTLYALQRDSNSPNKFHLDLNRMISRLRVIQEWISSMIKNIKAYAVSIPFTKDEHLLSFVVGDAVQGFKAVQKAPRESMRSSSLKSRLGHWEGFLEIDCLTGKDRRIILDINL